MVNHPNDTGSDNELSVALDTLQAGDGTQPEPGDEVEVQVKGKITRIDESRNCAYVEPTEANGEPPPDMGDGDNDADDLRNAASEADKGQGWPSQQSSY